MKLLSRSAVTGLIGSSHRLMVQSLLLIACSAAATVDVASADDVAGPDANDLDRHATQPLRSSAPLSHSATQPDPEWLSG